MFDHPVVLALCLLGLLASVPVLRKIVLFVIGWAVGLILWAFCMIILVGLCGRIIRFSLGFFS
jgi:hypothetical protein